MSHVRTQIREGVTAALYGATSCGDKVYQTRSWPLDDTAMPGICIYTSSETKSAAGLRSTARAVELVLDIYASGVAWESAADAVDAESEAILMAEGFLGDLVDDVQPTSSGSKLITDGAKPYGVLRVIYTINYTTRDGHAEEAV